MANSLHPNAIASIDADGGAPSGRGFHVNDSAPPLNPAQEGPAVRFAQVLIRPGQLQAAGIPPANYIGSDGLKGVSRPGRGGASTWPSTRRSWSSSAT